jgi:tryptophan-rich sensory protein
VLKGAQVLGTKQFLSKFQLGGLPLIQWLSFVLIIFNASAIKNIVDGSVSIANSQVLRPNVIPGDPLWYSNLKKPSWNPPGWLFPIMWVLISKPTQLVALQRLWKISKTDIPYFPQLALFCAHCTY